MNGLNYESRILLDYNPLNMHLAICAPREEEDANELTECISAILSLLNFSNSSKFISGLTPSKTRKKTLVWLSGLLDQLKLRPQTQDQVALLARYSLARRNCTNVESRKVALSCLYLAVKLAGDFTPQLASISKYRKFELGLSDSELARLELEILRETPSEIFQVTALCVFLKSLLALMHPLIMLSEAEFLKCKNILECLWTERPSINLINAALACFAFISKEPITTLLDANIVLNQYFAQVFNVDLGYKIGIAQLYLRSLLGATAASGLSREGRISKIKSLRL